MSTETYRTRNHVLPLVRARGTVVVVIPETSDWFRRAIEPHLDEDAQVRVEAAEGYAYCLQPQSVSRPPVLAARVVFRWRAGQLIVERATGTDGRPLDLNALFGASVAGVKAPKGKSKGGSRSGDDTALAHETPRSLEAAAAKVLDGPTEDTSLSHSNLHPSVQAELAETARQEGALRLALLARVQDADPRASALCVKLLGASFGGFDSKQDLYTQSAAKFAGSPYAPHLRDLIANLILPRKPGSLRDAAVHFCTQLKADQIETEWADDLLKRS
ncbi:hypothetical protein [Frigoriglobus tundricola]|uniref:hypothetical protein n=1 Tax=Frigoriglobus tundricola TaxID=2774151 RepID=UPI00148ED905|nr:hypothetical protein [Frigoriglobus tundricola]